MKKNTSDVINRTIRQQSPIATINVWCPCIVPSRVMSRHHWYIIIMVEIVPIKNSSGVNMWNHLIVIIALSASRIGHSLTSSRWNWWFSCIIIGNFSRIKCS